MFGKFCRVPTASASPIDLQEASLLKPGCWAAVWYHFFIAGVENCGKTGMSRATGHVFVSRPCV